MSLTSLPYKYYRFLWLSSWTSFAALSYGLYLGHPYNVYVIPGNVFITSIVYWSYPITYSWRYYLDIYTVQTHLLYALYRFYNSEYMIQIYIIWLIIVPCCYKTSLHYYKRKMYFEFVVYHSLIHACGNLGNIVAFSGKIEDLCAAKSWNQKFLCSW
jgi:hypothetical protein